MIKKMLKPKNLFMLGLTLVILYALFSPMSIPKPFEGFEGGKTMYLIHMDKCPYCVKMMPEWKKFKQMNNTGVVVKEIEQSEDPSFVKKHKATSFPTIIMTNGNKKIADYDGDRSAQSFLDFAKNNA